MKRKQEFFMILALAVTLFVQGLGQLEGQEPTRNTRFHQEILLIRHAEKVDDVTDIYLSRRGKERAENLHRLFEFSKSRPEPFNRPDFIFAAKNSKNSNRPLETVTPLAKKWALPIDDNFQSKVETTKKGVKELAQQIFQDKKYAGKVILVSGRHNVLPQLARLFIEGAPNRASVEPNIPNVWRDKVYDRVWMFRYDDAGNATFRDLPQQLLPGDSAK